MNPCGISSKYTKKYNKFSCKYNSLNQILFWPEVELIIAYETLKKKHEKFAWFH